MTRRARALVTLLGGFLLAAACGSGESPATISQSALAQDLQGDHAPILLDVRTPGEFASGHIPGAVNVPHAELESRISEIDPARTVVVYCESGARASVAESILRDGGFSDVRHLEGDMRAWRAHELPCAGC